MNTLEVRHAFADRTHDKPNIHMMEMSGAMAAPMFADGSLDFVYIDAEHTFEAVSADIRLWLPKIKPGGAIGGHDYDSAKHPGVRRAVDLYWPKVKVKVYQDSSWVSWDIEGAIKRMNREKDNGSSDRSGKVRGHAG